MKILAVGNSFSQDATRYLHQIAAADGVDLTVENLCIGGCSLERHCQEYQEELADYLCEYNGTARAERVTLRQALREEAWDFVTLQQASKQTVRYDTWQPYLGMLAGYIKEYVPGCRLVLHETWAYEQGCELLSSIGYTRREDMYRDLHACYQRAAAELGGVSIIPSGSVFDRAVRQGTGPLHRDGFHASFGAGRYLLGLVWYRFFSGNQVTGNTFRQFDEPIAQPLVAALQQLADQV